MFYKLPDITAMTIAYLSLYPDDDFLLSTIHKAYSSVNQKNIDDVEVLYSINFILKLVQEMIDSKPRPSQREVLTITATSPINFHIKRLVLVNVEDSGVLDKQAKKSFIEYMQLSAILPELIFTTDKLFMTVEKCKSHTISGVSRTIDQISNLMNTVLDAVGKLEMQDTTDNISMIDTLTNAKNSIGMEKLTEEISKKLNSKVKTTNPLWDGITGGGWSGGALYVLGAVSGNFKSGAMQNIIEDMACYEQNLKIIEEEGVTPYIAFVSGEMTKPQIYKRRLAYYGEKKLSEDVNDIADVLIKHGAKIPVIIIDCVVNKMCALDISNVVKKLYNTKKLKPIAIVVDYADIMKANPTSTPQKDTHLELRQKMEEFRNLAVDHDVPVITGMQLNREADSNIKQYLPYSKSIDLALLLNNAHIAKAHGLINIPEIIVLQTLIECKTMVNDELISETYLGMVVEKDRDNVSEQILTERDIKTASDVIRAEQNFRNANASIKYAMKTNDPRVHYVAKMDGFRITSDYSRTIRAFYQSQNSEVTVVTDMFDAIEDELGGDDEL
ncbi:MAG: DnaB-like helicase C-terminal domain-containing protein, partial [Paraclostridium sp.]